MIKMVISCVIAFALTWLPFNALIVIGDMHPDIWENQNIMYIWFLTHFLAMCHTITNPLIYVWMNNRFRTGFKLVFWDLYLPIKRSLAYLWYWLCCFGCLLECSRRKYSRVSLSLRERKQKLDLKTSSISGYANHSNNNHNATGAGSSHRPLAVSSSASATPFGGHSGGNNPRTRGPLATLDSASQQLPASIYDARSGDSHPLITAVPVASGSRGVQKRASQRLHCDATSSAAALPDAVTIEAPSKTADGLNVDSPARLKDKASSWSSVLDRQLGIICRPPGIRLLGRAKRGAAQRLGQTQGTSAKQKCHQMDPRASHDDDAAAVQGQQQTTTTTTTTTTNADGRRYRRRKKRSHVINIRMTTMEYRAPQYKLEAAGGASGGSGAQQIVAGSKNEETTTSAKTIKHSRAWWRKNNNNSSCGGGSQRGCPACLRRATTGTDLHRHDQSRLDGKSKDRSGKALGKLDDFIVDMHQSSQSTATISLLTNTTSLALSPLDSSRGGGGGGANNSTSISSAFSASAQAKTSSSQMALDNEETAGSELLKIATAINLATEEVERGTQSQELSGRSPLKVAGARSCDHFRFGSSDASDMKHLDTDAKAGGVVSLTNSLYNSSLDRPAGSTGTSGEDLAHYCHEHRCHLQHREGDSRREAGADEDSLQTDDDVCDVVFHDNHHKRAKLTTTQAGSLEMLSDHFDDDLGGNEDDDVSEEQEEDEQEVKDEDDEGQEGELESLEAEFGDESSPLRNSYAMVPLHKSGRQRRRPRCQSNRDSKRLLKNTKLCYLGQESSYANTEVDVANVEAKSFEGRSSCDDDEEDGALRPLRGLLKSPTIITNKPGPSWCIGEDLPAHNIRLAPERSSAQDHDNDGSRYTSSRQPTSSGWSRETNEEANGPRPTFDSSKSDRTSSLRRTMLLNNHLLSKTSTITSKSPQQTQSNSSNQNDVIEAAETISGGSDDDFGAQSRPPDTITSVPGNLERGSAAISGQADGQKEGARSCGAKSQTTTSSDDQAPGSSGCDKVVSGRAMNGGSAEANDNQSSSAPASVTKNSKPLKPPEPPVEQPINPGEGQRQRQWRRRRRRRHQVLGSSNENEPEIDYEDYTDCGESLSIRNGRHQHHSFTSLSLGQQQLGVDGDLNSFKSLEDSLARQPHDGTEEVLGRRRRRCELMTGQERGRGEDLIDRLGGGKSELEPLFSPERMALFGVGSREDGDGGSNRKQQQQMMMRGPEELFSWNKSASTVVVRKSPTVYLLSKTLASEDHGK